MTAPDAGVPSAHAVQAAPGAPVGGDAGGYTAAPPAAPGTPEGVAIVRYAGFWRRFWGLVVDSVALSLVLTPLRLGLRFNGWRDFDRGDMSLDRLVPLLMGSMVLFSVHLVVDALYFTLMQSSVKQATLGQMLLGIRVTDLEGRRLSGGRALGRYVAAWLSSLTLMIGFIIGAFTEKKQTLHDMIARTLVVRG